jgi:hypothetical protein
MPIFLRSIILVYPTLLFIIKIFFSTHFLPSSLHLLISTVIVSLRASFLYPDVEAASSSKTSVYFYQTKRRHLPDYQNLHCYRLENLNLRVASSSLWLIVSKLKSIVEPQNLHDKGFTFYRYACFKAVSGRVYSEIVMEYGNGWYLYIRRWHGLEFQGKFL